MKHTLLVLLLLIGCATISGCVDQRNQLLKQLLTDDPTARTRALHTLKETGDQDTLRRLFDTLKSTNTQEKDRAAAALKDVKAVVIQKWRKAAAQGQGPSTPLLK